MKQERFPPGWDARRVQSVLSHYDEQTEDEAAFADQTQAVMEIPLALVPAVRELLAKHFGGSRIPA